MAISLGILTQHFQTNPDSYTFPSMILIVDFPIKNGGSFHSYVNVYQRVPIPEKTTCILCNVTQDFLATLPPLRPGWRPLRPGGRRERIALPGLHGQQPGEDDHRHRKCGF